MIAHVKAMLRRLLYISEAWMTQDVRKNIDDILKTSRKMNSVKGITGHLMFHKDHFMQMIEGQHDDIERLITNIKLDSRHHNVRVVQDFPVDDREFSTWSMGFANLDNFPYYEKVDDVIDFSDLNYKFLNLSKILRVFAKFAQIHEQSRNVTV